MPNLSKLYNHRFEEARRDEKLEMWRAIYDGYLKKVISGSSTVVDLASGYGEFSNNVSCENLICIDLNPDATKYLPDQVEFHNVSALEASEHVGENRADLVFTSNFLEHLFSKNDCDVVLGEVYKMLKPGGKFLILGPNIKYVGDAYWDFYDHYLPLSHLSLEEGLIQSGFEVEFNIPKFLPYTTKSALPTSSWLIKMYLKFPIAWKILGKQFLVCGKKPI